MNPENKMTYIHFIEVMTKNKFFSDITINIFGKKKIKIKVFDKEFIF